MAWFASVFSLTSEMMIKRFFLSSIQEMLHFVGSGTFIQATLHFLSPSILSSLSPACFPPSSHAAEDGGHSTEDSMDFWTGGRKQCSIGIGWEKVYWVTSEVNVGCSDVVSEQNIDFIPSWHGFWDTATSVCLGSSLCERTWLELGDDW